MFPLLRKKQKLNITKKSLKIEEHLLCISYKTYAAKSAPKARTAHPHLEGGRFC